MFSEHGRLISDAALRLSLGHAEAARAMVRTEARSVCRTEYEIWQDVVDLVERCYDLSALDDDALTLRGFAPRQVRERALKGGEDD